MKETCEGPKLQLVILQSEGGAVVTGEVSQEILNTQANATQWEYRIIMNKQPNNNNKVNNEQFITTLTGDHRARGLEATAQLLETSNRKECDRAVQKETALQGAKALHRSGSTSVSHGGLDLHGRGFEV